jgi:lipoate-protein ligase A
MPSQLRLLPFLDSDGPTQMALDEALLDAAPVPTLRCYAWRPATVSLGFFQDAARVRAQLPRPVPLVRRITGGGAIWHEHEITYCLVGTLGADGLDRQPQAVYARIHAAIRAQLPERGAGVLLQGSTVGDRRYATEPRCFASPAVHDLVADQGGKLLGSAARCRGDRMLLHGSLKLASNPWDGAVVSGCGLDAAAATQALIAGIAGCLGCAVHPAALSAAEEAAAARIRAERYDDAAWVEARSGRRP